MFSSLRSLLSDGNLIVTQNGLRALYKKTYMERLSHKQIRPEYEQLKSMKENLFELRYQLSSKMKSDDWNSEDVEKICKSLKKTIKQEMNVVSYMSYLNLPLLGQMSSIL